MTRQHEQNEILLWIETELEKEVRDENSTVWKGKDAIIDALALTIYAWSHGGPTKFRQVQGEDLLPLEIVGKDEWVRTAKAALKVLDLLKVKLIQS